MRKSTPKRAILYARYSDRPDAETCDSCDVQLANMRRWCAEHGYVVEAEFRDDALGGADLDRPQLALALKVPRRGMIFLVRDFKRLSRDAHHRLGVAIDLHRRGVKLVSMSEGAYKADDPEWMLLFTILAGVGAYERATIARATRVAMRRHQAAGRSMSSIAPYGTRVEGKALVPVTEEQAVIAKIVAWHAEGLAYNAIAGRLNAAGIAPRGNRYRPGAGAWNHKAVKRILDREPV